jgi:hypothetical protein
LRREKKGSGGEEAKRAQIACIQTDRQTDKSAKQLPTLPRKRLRKKEKEREREKDEG